MTTPRSLQIFRLALCATVFGLQLGAAELPALGYQPDPSEPSWSASWIWLQGEAYSVNVHLQARKEFNVSNPGKQARLRISAYSDYIVYINGQRVGRGPEWNDPEYQTYDVYDVGRFLVSGRNVIGVVAHNYGIGTHWSRRNRGGLIAQLDFDGSESIGTDATWKIERGDAWLNNSPRIFWSAGFLETFDFRRYDSAWLRPGFDSTSWHTPEVLGRPPVSPWIRLLRRQIPLLKETLVPASGIETGHSKLPSVHAVRFDKILPAGQSGIVYAETTLQLEQDREVDFHIECDDAFRFFLNGEQRASFGYDETFARTRLWNGEDVYDQAHYGMSSIQYADHSATLHLKKGSNRLLVAVDQDVAGWGFLLLFRDRKTHVPLDIEFGSETPADRTWKLAGPYATTGLSNSLDDVKHDLTSLHPRATVTYSPFEHSGVTDYAALMDAEERSGSPLTMDRVTLNEGEYAIFDFAKIRTGFPEIEVTSSNEGVLDIGYTEVLTPDRRVRLAAYGSMRYVDRIIVKKGAQVWQPYDRRTARYLHISCRRGQSIQISVHGVSAIGYPVTLQASFESSDPMLNRIWATSVYTAELVMQQGYQDCLKREQGTLNTSSFNYTSKGAAYSFGDFALARKNILQALRTQDRTGWFDSHGVSSPNSDEPTECLWWAVWLKDYYQLSGDEVLVRELFSGLENNLRFFTKGINHFGLIEGGNQPIAWRGQGIYIDDAAEEGNYNGLFPGELLGMNQLYSAALHSAAYLARELNLADRAGLYERYAARVDHSIEDRFWDPGAQLYRDWRLKAELATTHHPIFQITALYFDSLAPERRERLLRYLTDELGFPTKDRAAYPLTTFGYYYYFLDVLFRSGRDAEALELMRTVYGRWLELGTTTFGEFFRPAELKGKTQIDYEYEVHAYGVSALAHFYTNILGIRPAEPGFRKIAIAPHPGRLKWARGKVSTPKGPVTVSWKAESGVFNLEAQVPNGCAFELRVPEGFSRYRLSMNGKLVEAAGKIVTHDVQ